MFKNTRAATPKVAKPVQVTEASKKLVKKSEDEATIKTSDYDDWLAGYKSRNPAGHNKITGLE